MAGVFATWQPRYADVAVPSFPVIDKRPAIKGYLKVGLTGSRDLAAKFGGAAAFGVPLNRARITVLDVDTPDERVLADAMAEVGESPFIVRSGSGNWQAWYRNAGEARRVRPDPSKPIDILGAGYAVAAPSQTTNGAYSIVQGCLDDLPNLPKMRPGHRWSKSSTYTVHPPPLPSLPACPNERLPLDGTSPGERNSKLWRFLMKQARHCDDFDTLLDVARSAASAFDSATFTAAEVEATARSAWKYESEGRNWVGLGARPLPATDPIGLIAICPDAFILWTLLRHNHAGKDSFIVANAMADTMPGGWARKRFAAARKALVAAGHIREIKAASTWTGAAVYTWA